ncbi:NDR1/HIN1-like protein 13 [Phoenix dactylifera]|uniref:NDR1/HIN1-like protein 13 n=1 Tax=Phoenix dactylifera TaxID=42345 RepID=A0A8B7BWF7_PHODC|nr:NDR1/HIN1-like protein 13 [Phoenix dactylifera]XP_008786761.2 NDR1/HIN1-like protein 13 [Phoenix dactylifera]XP_008786762.2 NDR1/HIN1-like protein 13 [Phoenix dactylifera]XP_008786763.2 NDR1/HIN1-like protein 13 [Phoenix dactylifera]XP_026659632.2 NDR1/HIN1-like protein 13 [Phoenix dactylifera]
MDDRVHPAESTTAEEKMAAPAEPAAISRPENPLAQKNIEKLKPPPGTYVIQIPKDQIYRVPPPENARRFQTYTLRTHRRRHGCCCCCFAWTAALLLFFLVALAAAAVILYFVFQPKIPNYSVDGLSVKGFNLSSTAANLAADLAALSPEFDATVRADNANKKIGIYYRSGSSIAVSYDGVNLCHGVWPTFYQGERNATVFQTALTGSGIRLAAATHAALVTAQSHGKVPLEINIQVPVRLKFSAVTTWTITVKVRCDVTVDKLTADSRIISKSCSVKVDPF